MIASPIPQQALPRTPDEALAFLAARSPSSIRLGLDAMSCAVEALGHPQKRYRTLHVAGTNGKGSTCAFATSLLGAEGLKVGLYTSPHLLRVNERIQVDGEPIADAVLGQRILEVLEKYPEAKDLTFFEFGTLLAFWHFAQEKVDVAVLETGLGGRLDATSVCAPNVTAISPIAFDHMEYLGNTLPDIAVEKAGILRANVPAVFSQQRSEAKAALEEKAAQIGAPVFSDPKDFGISDGPNGLQYRGIHPSMPPSVGLVLGLRGNHQRMNAALSLASVELLLAGQGRRLSEDGMRRGLANARWPGRLEEIAQNPTVIVDGAHNAHGAQALRDALETLYSGRQVHLVFGVLADKDSQAMARLLFPLASTLHLAKVGNPRAEDPHRMKAKYSGALPKDTFVHSSVETALDKARTLASREDVVVCAGSLYLVGQVKLRLTP